MQEEVYVPKSDDICRFAIEMVLNEIRHDIHKHQLTNRYASDEIINAMINLSGRVKQIPSLLKVRQ